MEKYQLYVHQQQTDDSNKCVLTDFFEQGQERAPSVQRSEEMYWS